jgi:hypothetical protein
MLINRNDETQTGFLAGQYEELQKSGLAPHPQSPAGAALLRAYKQHQANQENQGTAAAVLSAGIVVKTSMAEVKRLQKKQAKKAAKKLRKFRKAYALAPSAVEDRAMRQGIKRLRSALDAHMTSADALNAGFDAYQRDGGKLTLGGFKRRMTEHLK